LSPDDLVIASDGYCARRVRVWTREKLYYIDRYLDIFCTAMKDKRDLVYADMLAGPGLCVDKATGNVVRGSPLLALKRAPFCRLFLNDKDSRCSDALGRRTACEPCERVQIANQDCNDAVDAARRFLFPPGSETHTLGVAVIDPTGFQFSFESLRRLTQGVRLDLIIIFMTGFIKRFISRPSFEPPLDRFFGTESWRDLVPGSGRITKVTYDKLLSLYEDQLKTSGYGHVNHLARIPNTRGSTIYHIVFASKHRRGNEFFKKIAQKRYGGQQRLPL